VNRDGKERASRTKHPSFELKNYLQGERNGPSDEKQGGRETIFHGIEKREGNAGAACPVMVGNVGGFRKVLAFSRLVGRREIGCRRPEGP